MPDLTDRQQEFVDAYVAENNIKAAADAGNDKIAEFNLEVRPEERGTT